MRWSVWQAARIRTATSPLPNSCLFPRPSSDPERLEELRQVEKTTYAAYQRMLAAALKDPSLHLVHTSDGKLWR
jgi:hypothetical protein